MALDSLPCPALEWLLAHGQASRAPAAPYEHALAAVFGLAADAPFGALRCLGEAPDALAADPRQGFWLCADPVHLRFHHERIILADAGAFELHEDEARTLADSLNREFADIGEFHVPDSRRWYVRLKAASPFQAAPLSAVAGRRIDGDLPETPQASHLRAWLNEVQMFLHSHPVNEARARTGQPAVNSLWLWGAGALAQLADPDVNAVWATDPLALGLARAAGAPTRPLPQRLDTLLTHAAPQGGQLVVLDDLLPPVLYEDSQAWHDTLLRLEADWFAPLKRALGKPIARLDLIAPTIYGQLTWRIAAGERWKFWRRPQPIAALAHQFASQP